MAESIENAVELKKMFWLQWIILPQKIRLVEFWWKESLKYVINPVIALVFLSRRLYH